MSFLNDVMNGRFQGGGVTRTLPNGGGTYSPAGTAPAALAPIPKVTLPINPIFSKGVNTPAPTPIAPGSTTAPTPQKRDPYINPKTGQYYTPQEYATAVATTLPVNKPVSGDVGKYAGDAITKPNQSVADMTKTASKLNNARNDMATGETDPYDITQGGTIVYSPEERSAIEKAYAGVYDPALQDVFTKITAKEKADKEESDRKARREEQIFATNENIRQWQATTGGKDKASEDLFTRKELNDGAVNAGMELPTFEKLSDDLKNFYINQNKEKNPETNEDVLVSDSFENLIKGVRKGAITKEEAIAEIEDSTLPIEVKKYFTDRVNATVSEGKKDIPWVPFF
jgi:hypothetical protein